MKYSKIVFFSLCILLIVCHECIAQNNSAPYLKSCSEHEDSEQRKICTEEKLAELIKTEFDKTEVFHKADENLDIELELSISSRGIIRISNFKCDYAIKKYIVEAITNIGYKVVMKPALENDIKIDSKATFNIVLNNYLPTGKKEKTSLKTSENNKPQIFKVVEQMPRFPGCEDEDSSEKEIQNCAKDLMLEYLYENLKPTQNGYDEFIEGTFVVQFVVYEDGSLQDFEFVRILGECDQCVTRMTEVLKGMPEWVPGLHRGRPVRVLYTLPIKYKRDN